MPRAFPPPNVSSTVSRLRGKQTLDAGDIRAVAAGLEHLSQSVRDLAIGLSDLATEVDGLKTRISEVESH